MSCNVKLKICGIRRAEDIECINEVEPDYIGFVFAKSKRQIDESTAKQLKSMLNPEIQAVGVFVNEEPEVIIRMLNRGIIDIAQLHGSEDIATADYIRSMTGKPVIKALIVDGKCDITEWTGSSVDYLLLDSGRGSGVTFDWSNITSLDIKDKPFFLAGGINPDNVAKAIADAAPYCIDVSSGVEADGYKEPELIKRLCVNMAEACSKL